MEIITIIYIVFFSMIFLALGIVILVIAGKDILYAFMRFINKKGCEVYVINSNRNISHFYKTPKDDMFKIKGDSYITNPSKTMNLTEIDRKRVLDSIKKTTVSFKIRILELDKKKKFLETKADKCSDAMIRNTYKAEIENIKKDIEFFEGKLKDRTTNYFKDKRPAFFYIEGDPVPKDMHEWYSTLDCKIMDNIVSRAISKPVESYDEKQIKMLKILIICAIGAAAFAAILAFQSSQTVNNMCLSLSDQFPMKCR